MICRTADMLTLVCAPLSHVFFPTSILNCNLRIWSILLSFKGLLRVYSWKKKKSLQLSSVVGALWDQGWFHGFFFLFLFLMLQGIWSLRVKRKTWNNILRHSYKYKCQMKIRIVSSMGMDWEVRKLARGSDAEGFVFQGIWCILDWSIKSLGAKFYLAWSVF